MSRAAVVLSSRWVASTHPTSLVLMGELVLGSVPPSPVVMGGPFPLLVNNCGQHGLDHSQYSSYEAEYYLCHDNFHKSCQIHLGKDIHLIAFYVIHLGHYIFIK
jgi:hypothetical protein